MKTKKLKESQERAELRDRIKAAMDRVKEEIEYITPSTLSPGDIQRLRRALMHSTNNVYFEFAIKLFGAGGYMRKVQHTQDNGKTFTLWECGRFEEIGKYTKLAEGSKPVNVLIEGYFSQPEIFRTFKL